MDPGPWLVTCPDTTLILTDRPILGQVRPGEALSFYSALKSLKEDNAAFHPKHILDFLICLSYLFILNMISHL